MNAGREAHHGYDEKKETDDGTTAPGPDSSGAEQRITAPFTDGEGEGCGSLPAPSGIICLCVIAGRYQRTAEPVQLTRALGFDLTAPVTDVQVVLAAKELGLKAKSLRTTWESLPRRSLPAIAEFSGGEFVVLLRSDPDGSVLVGDPRRTRPKRLSREQLEGAWSGRIVLIKSRLRLENANPPFDPLWLVPAIWKYRRILWETLAAAFVRKRYGARRAVPIAIAAIILAGCGVGSSGKVAKLQFRLRTGFPVTSVAWSSDGRYIATGSTADRRIDIWDMSSRRIIKVLLRKFPPASFHQISWSPSGQYLAFCDAPGVLRIYRTRDWTEAHVLSGPRGDAGCTQSSFSSDSGEVALLATHFLGVYSVPGWQTLKAVNLNVGWSGGDLFNDVAYLPNTHTVLVGGGQYEKGGWDGRVWFFAASDQVPGRSIGAYRRDRGGGGPVVSLAVDPQARFIVTGAKTGAGNQFQGWVTESVHILNTRNGSLTAAPLDHLPPLRFGSDEGLAYTPDGRDIIVAHGGEDGWIHVVDGRSFAVIDLVRSDDFSYDVAVNEVSDNFAVGVNNEVIIWSLSTR